LQGGDKFSSQSIIGKTWNMSVPTETHEIATHNLLYNKTNANLSSSNFPMCDAKEIKPMNILPKAANANEKSTLKFLGKAPIMTKWL